MFIVVIGSDVTYTENDNNIVYCNSSFLLEFTVLGMWCALCIATTAKSADQFVCKCIEMSYWRFKVEQISPLCKQFHYKKDSILLKGVPNELNFKS